MERQKRTWMKSKRKAGTDLAVLLVMVILVITLCIANKANPISYEMYTSEGVTYEKGTVTQILEENLEKEKGSDRYRGTQVLKVLMKRGDLEGQEIEVSNELSSTHNILSGVGQNLVIKVDAPEGVTPFYSVFNYDRTTGILKLLAMFALLMILTGGVKGIRSMLGLAFAMFLIMAFLLPVIYHGWPPVAASIITALLITVFSMVLLNGISRKTAVASAATMAGVFAAAVIYYIFSSILHLSGFNLEEAEELILIQNNTGMQVGELLFTGILIASLGAVMDMTMSVASSLFEMKHIHPEMTKKEIFQSGMVIGKDMTGTMCQTLVLAFAGTGVAALLVLISYGSTFNQLLSSDYVSLELMHSLTGSMAVILAVPITAFITAVVLGKNPEKVQEMQNKSDYDRILSLRGNKNE